MIFATYCAATLTALSPAFLQDSGSQPGQDLSVTVLDTRDLAEIFGDQIDRTMNSLCAMVGAGCASLADGVYAVGATPGQAEAIHEVLDGMRELHDNRYDTELVMIGMTGLDLPNIGSSLTLTGDAAARVRHSIREGASVGFDASTTINYIADLQPVVSDSAVGYAPGIEQVLSGLQAEVSISSTLGGIELSLRGSVTDVSVADVNLNLLGGDSLLLQVPTVSSRSIAGSQKLQFGELTVVSVLSGFEPGESIVIAVRVSELP